MTAEEIKTLKWWFYNKGPMYYFEKFVEQKLIIEFDEKNNVVIFENKNGILLESKYVKLSDFGQISRFS
jgi:hypothetical protein